LSKKASPVPKFSVGKCTPGSESMLVAWSDFKATRFHSYYCFSYPEDSSRELKGQVAKFLAVLQHITMWL